jgi:hypothetical protein
MKSIQYPLPATTFSPAECQAIMRPLLKVGLAASGVMSSMARAIVFGPLRYQGLAIPDLYVFQGVKHIEKIICYSLSKDNISTGSLIRASLEATKLELGLPGSVLSQDFSKHGCLATKTWCTHTWEFLHSNGMRIADKVAELYTQREHDQFLTEAFAKASFSESQRIRLNKCRIFLQAVTLSDITTGNGQVLLQSAWQGHLDQDNPSSCQWMNQGPLTTADWALWRQALTKCFCSKGQSLLRQPLGKWTRPPTSTWRWYLDTATERLLEQHNGTVKVYSRKAG